MIRGKRKGRGGRKGPQSASDLPSDSPKRKDSRIEFQGLLSHASPPIKNFFQPITKEQNLPVDKDIVKSSDSSDEPTSWLEENEGVKVPPSEKLILEGSEKSAVCDHTAAATGTVGEEEIGKRPQSPATPHKMILLQAGEPPLLSPSNALSQLTIANGGAKKTSKSRRKLNPNQTSNQLAPVPNGSKLSCCTKSKGSSVNETKTSNAATASNGSQHKLTEYFPVRRSVRKTKKTVMEEKQKSLEEAVLTCKEEGLRVHNFEGKGRGIVAVRHFSKGEFVVEYAGELIKMDDARDREKLYAQDQNTGCYMYYFKYRNQQYCVDATPESDRLGRLVNHSRNGNLLTKTITVDDLPRLVLIAKEDIQPGEEITYDYGDRSKESLKYHPWLAC